MKAEAIRRRMNLPDRDKIFLKALEREVELRNSDFFQKRFEDVEKDGSTSDWINVVEHEIQPQALTELDLEVNGANRLKLIQTALEHPEVAFWVRFNRLDEGSLKIGDQLPDIEIFDFSSQSHLLIQSTLDLGKKHLLLAGSVS